MENVVRTLNRHISQNLGEYCVVRDQDRLRKALEAFLFKSIFETSGINSSFEVVAKHYLNQVSADPEIGPIFRIITSINDQLKATNTSFNDGRLVRILLLELCVENKR
jgi:hypothetical protein